MDIFKDLIDELKEENLLEETVIDSAREESAVDISDPLVGESDEVPESPTEYIGPGEDASDVELSETEPEEMTDSESESSDINADINHVEPPVDDPDPETSAESIEEVAEVAEVAEEEDVQDPSLKQQLDARIRNLEGGDEESVDSAESESALEVDDEAAVAEEETKNEEEDRLFYRQRAVDEVSALQMVEHVISGVEREQRKSVPQMFDDLKVKRALHDFLKLADLKDSPDHAEAEFNLMQETENWCSALSIRDKKINAGHLRRYCETTKPNLSAQALIALARFYRNAPYSEAVRGKFDLIITRLFSKDEGEERRSVVFKDKELVKHIHELYADWSSIPLYSTDENDSDLLVIALKFHDFIDEANKAGSFDDLVRSEFFNRLKKFKKETNENFFAPTVVASAIENNIEVGNRFVELIEQQRDEPDANLFGEKHGLTHDDSISDAAGKTLELLDLLKEKEIAVPVKPKAKEKPMAPPPPAVKTIDQIEAETKKESKGINKLLIAATIVISIITVWFFMMGPSDQEPQIAKGDSVASTVEVKGTALEMNVHSARLSRATLFGVVRENWTKLSKEERSQLLSSALKMGDEKGFAKVLFLNSKGESVGFASDKKVVVY